MRNGWWPFAGRAGFAGGGIFSRGGCRRCRRSCPGGYL